MVIYITKLPNRSVTVRRLASIATLVLALAATGCAHAVPPDTSPAASMGVRPLQPFGSEPELMPALSFEPLAGRLDIRAPQPVYVTVVEVDPATQAQTVVFPELGRAPLRVAGAISLQLALSRAGALALANGDTGQPKRRANRGPCATDAARWGDEVGACAGRLTDEHPDAPARTVLVIASTDTLVVAGGEGTAAWRIPDEMPAEWAAVYVWAGARPAAP
jgi:hypothetical protein